MRDLAWGCVWGAAGKRWGWDDAGWGEDLLRLRGKAPARDAKPTA